MVIFACPVCGEFPQLLPGWEPVEQELPDGGVRIEGTPVYCACTRPEDE